LGVVLVEAVAVAIGSATCLEWLPALVPRQPDLPVAASP
jgi:hypothetical protein